MQKLQFGFFIFALGFSFHTNDTSSFACATTFTY